MRNAELEFQQVYETFRPRIHRDLARLDGYPIMLQRYNRIKLQELIQTQVV